MSLLVLEPPGPADTVIVGMEYNTGLALGINWKECRVVSSFATKSSELHLASETARSADRTIGQGRFTSPLLGIPVSIKDLEATKGIRSTMGSLIFHDTVPDINSVVAEPIPMPEPMLTTLPLP